MIGKRGRWRGGAGVLVTLALLLCQLVVPARLDAAEELYPPDGIKPVDVRQGALGSCYFHAVIAALAQSRAQLLRQMIRTNDDGTYTVQFADGKKEIVYPEDLRYTRDTHFDRSEGLWVAVLFRAYAQRVLREALLSSIEKSELFPLLKRPAEDLISTNDLLLLAYDRAIRSQVDQYGDIDRTRLETRLKTEMQPLALPDSIKDSMIKLLESGGFFESMTEAIKQNGELFGAYRAVGQGGIAEGVMQTFAGNLRFEKNESETQAASALGRAVEAKLPIVACSGGSRYYDQVAAGQPLPSGTENWYVNAHCYTVLGFDSGDNSVLLRNPWAHHPDPLGVFKLPVKDFVPAFLGILTAE
jgi:hypothetical protein